MIQEVYLIDNDDKIKDKLVKMFEKESKNGNKRV